MSAPYAIAADDGRIHFDRLDQTGDSAFRWDPNSPVEVEGARAQFESLRAEGYRFYKTRLGGLLGAKEVCTFDAMQRALVAKPPAKSRPAAKVEAASSAKAPSAAMVVATPKPTGGYPSEEVSI